MDRKVGIQGCLGLGDRKGGLGGVWASWPGRGVSEVSGPRGQEGGSRGCLGLVDRKGGLTGVWASWTGSGGLRGIWASWTGREVSGASGPRGQEEGDSGESGPCGQEERSLGEGLVWGDRCCLWFGPLQACGEDGPPRGKCQDSWGNGRYSKGRSQGFTALLPVTRALLSAHRGRVTCPSCTHHLSQCQTACAARAETET